MVIKHMHTEQIDSETTHLVITPLYFPVLRDISTPILNRVCCFSLDQFMTDVLFICLFVRLPYLHHKFQLLARDILLSNSPQTFANRYVLNLKLQINKKKNILKRWILAPSSHTARRFKIIHSAYLKPTTWQKTAKRGEKRWSFTAVVSYDA